MGNWSDWNGLVTVSITFYGNVSLKGSRWLSKLQARIRLYSAFGQDGVFSERGNG